MTKTDLVAKLLANENLTVIQAPVSTASFDIKNRVLRLPQWKDMTNDLIDMLIGHEVGHALYTTLEDYSTNNPYKEVPHFAGYMNVLEDVRIEKLMKRRYPGLRKSFNLGYKELNDRDFFGVANGFKDMLLIDKINLYFKAGYSCGVTFTAEEKAFVRRAEETETCDDVITLAKEIYDFSKKAMEEKIEEMKAQSDQHEEFEDEEESEQEQQSSMSDMTENDDDFEETEDQSPAPSTMDDPEQDLEDSLEDQLESQTEKALKDNLQELADTSVEYQYYTIPKFKVDPVITFKQVFEQHAKYQSEYNDYNLISEDDMERADKLKASSKNIVNYLIKEFEMRKSAQNYKRAKVAKTGSLDGKKLYAYKLNDDIFKQVMTIPNGKNHGMVFLLDWSASMDHVLRPTIEQVITLAMFCKGAQIPFQVFAFTNGWEESRYRDAEGSRLNLYGNKEVDTFGLYMMELFSSKMTQSEFNRMINITLSKYFNNLGNFKTSGTPLNSALAWLYNYIPEFKNKNGVEKTTLITLTDGEGEYIRSSMSQIRTSREHRDAGNYVTIKPFLSDTVTHKNYSLEDNATQTKSLLQMIKDRHNIVTVGFYITRPSYRSLATAINAHYGYNSHANSYAAIETMKRDLRRNGFTSLKDTGRDELFIVAESRTKIEDDKELTIGKKESAAKIARELTKVLSGKKTSRILLNQFIGLVA
jgi:hypothetical protein